MIRGVAAGETWIPPAELGQVLTFLLRQRDERADRERLLAQLTRREREVLTCIAEGFSRTQVAEHLDLQVNTVRTHIQNIMSKLHVHSALEAVALARAGLAPPEGAGIRTSAHDRITQVSYSE